MTPKTIPRELNRGIVKQVSHSIGIAGAMNEPLWLGDANHRTLYVNPVYEELSGYTLAECLGKPSDFCFDQESKKRIAEHHQLRGKGMASKYEATMVSKSGKRIPVLVSRAPTAEGGTIGIFLNLSKIKTLLKKERIAEQVIKHTTDAIVVLDQKRNIKLWSSGATKMLGHKEEEVLGNSIDMLIPSDQLEKNRTLISEVEKQRYIKNVEAKRVTKNGEIIDVTVSIAKVADKNDSFIGYLVIYSNITQQKRTSTELQKRFEAIQDAYKELGLQKRQSDYIYEIISAATSKNTTVKSLQQLIVSAFSLLTKCDAATLRMLENKGQSLKLKAGFGIGPKWWDKNQIKLENSLAEEAFKKKRPIIIDEIGNNPKHQGLQLLKRHRLKTLIIIPLHINGKPMGTISLYAKDPAKFRLIETDFLEKIGKQCSLALYAKSTLK
jgi:PAS domain S-box-containing protein